MVEPDGDVGGPVDQHQQPVRHGGAVCGGVESGCQVAQWEVELGREDEHRQRRLEGDATIDEPDSHRHCDERDAECGRQLQHRAGEKREAEGTHRRGAVSSLTRAIRSLWASPRLNARSVGRPRTTSRKWLASRDIACQRARARLAVERPISQKKTGTSGRVSSISPAETDR